MNGHNINEYGDGYQLAVQPSYNTHTHIHTHLIILGNYKLISFVCQNSSIFDYFISNIFQLTADHHHVWVMQQCWSFLDLCLKSIHIHCDIVFHQHIVQPGCCNYKTFNPEPGLNILLLMYFDENLRHFNEHSMRSNTWNCSLNPYNISYFIFHFDGH